MLCLVKDAIRTHGHLANLRITAEFDEPKIVLRGRVDSFYLKQVAQEVAMKTLRSQRREWFLENHIDVSE